MRQFINLINWIKSCPWRGTNLTDIVAILTRIVGELKIKFDLEDKFVSAFCAVVETANIGVST